MSAGARLLAALDALPPSRGAPLGLAVGVVITGLLLGPGHWLGAVLACVGVAGAFVLAITGRSRWEDTAASPTPVPAPAGPQRVEDPLLDHMVRLPAGEFIMGSDEYPNESPPHRVRLSAFAMGATPVTVGQWNRLMDKYHRPGEPDLPVARVSWLHAIRFCNAASALAGLRPAYVEYDDRVRWDRSADGYRLPTEAEWEYACRAGTTTRWSCGDDPAALTEHAWFAGNAGDTAHPVAKKRANPWGLFDMHGNVWEWCWDVYDASAYSLSQDVDNPVGLVDKVDNYGTVVDKSVDTVNKIVNTFVNKPRVVRGGSFWFEPEYLRSSNRNWDYPQYLSGGLGFRCVRGPERQP